MSWRVGRWHRLRESEIGYSLRRSPLTVFAAMVTLAFAVAAIAAPLLAPHNPYDLASLSLVDALTPPRWDAKGKSEYLLGTDDQGRDVLSTIIYGARLSLAVGATSVLLAASLGVTLGLVSGYVGGRADAVMMRIADVQMSFPAILIALLIDGVLRGVLPLQTSDDLAIVVIILAIGLSTWPQYARTVRASTMVERAKDYVKAAQLIGRHSAAILAHHVLPNVMGPVLVIATIQLAVAIILEATLSFLGVGIPPTTPSLGTMLRIGNNFMFSGQWWIIAFPGVALAMLVLSVNLLGDWLRDVLNPKLR